MIPDPETAPLPRVIPSALFSFPGPKQIPVFTGGGGGGIPVTSRKVDLGRKVRQSLSLGLSELRIVGQWRFAKIQALWPALRSTLQLLHLSVSLPEPCPRAAKHIFWFASFILESGALS